MFAAEFTLKREYHADGTVSETKTLTFSLIVESSRPLRAVETDFAIDRSGFASSKFERWFDHKYGVTRQKCV